MLEYEGLILSDESEGRKRFSLTEAGRAEAQAATDPAGDDQRHRGRRQRAVEVSSEARRKLSAIPAE
jgi:hypothetical protein